MSGGRGRINEYKRVTEMSDKLNPCPFCGGDAQLTEQIKVNDGIYYKSKWHVHCNNCMCGTFVRDTKTQCVDEWNKRHERG